MTERVWKLKEGDRVRVVDSVFEEAVGTVVRVIPGRAQTIPREFVVKTVNGLHRFFEQQLIFIGDAVVSPDAEI
jgi:transcription antitermination factor NusG